MLSDIEKSTMTWRWAALSVYLLICFYDFLFVPVWYGLNRPNIEQFMEIINSTEHVLVQMELMKKKADYIRRYLEILMRSGSVKT